MVVQTKKKLKLKNIKKRIEKWEKNSQNHNNPRKRIFVLCTLDVKTYRIDSDSEKCLSN